MAEEPYETPNRRKLFFRGALLGAVILLVLWVYKVDVYLGLGSGQVTGITMMGWSRQFRRGAGYGSIYYYLTVAGQPEGAPTEFSQFLPGVLEKTKSQFHMDDSMTPTIRRCTIHYAGLWKHVVTRVELAP